MDKYCRIGHATDDHIIGCMRIACWIPTATDTLSEYVLLIAFSRQQSLREIALISNYTYRACFVVFIVIIFSYILICLAGPLLLLLSSSPSLSSLLLLLSSSSSL